MPELAFLTNMNISPLTVEELRKLGWDIVRMIPKNHAKRAAIRCSWGSAEKLFK